MALNWRDYLEVHPAAELFPLMSEAELKELAADIEKNGLRIPIVMWPNSDKKLLLIDGRNRLDALAELGVLYNIDGELGLKSWTGTKWAQLSGDRIRVQHLAGGDPYALALSFNVHRRHLTREQKRDLIAKVLKAKPEVSNREIAKQVKADDKRVATVRRDLEANAEIPHKADRIEADGRKARGRKPAEKKQKTAEVAADDPAESAERMKAAHAIADATVLEELILDLGKVRSMAEGMPRVLGHLNLSDGQRLMFVTAVCKTADAWVTARKLLDEAAS